MANPKGMVPNPSASRKANSGGLPPRVSAAGGTRSNSALLRPSDRIAGYTGISGFSDGRMPLDSAKRTAAPPRSGRTLRFQKPEQGNRLQYGCKSGRFPPVRTPKGKGFASPRLRVMPIRQQAERRLRHGDRGKRVALRDLGPNPSASRKAIETGGPASLRRRPPGGSQSVSKPKGD